MSECPVPDCDGTLERVTRTEFHGRGPNPRVVEVRGVRCPECGFEDTGGRA